MLQRVGRVAATWKVWVPVLVVVLAAFGVGLTVADDDGDGRPDRVVIEKRVKPAVPVAVGVDGPDKDSRPDDVIVLDREAREVAQNAQGTPERFDMSGDLRGEDGTPVGQREGPLATPNVPGCRTRFLPTNFSNRVSTVKGFGVHYTAGLNRPGWSDMDGLTAFASSPSAGVSWHFLIDAEGHCYYSVPLDKKAWTIGNLNSQLVNVEVIGRGDEATFPAGTAGAKKLGRVARFVAKVYKFPVRLGAVSNCQVTVSGIVTHWMGGACSGGHVDIKPYDIGQVVKAIAAGACDRKCARARGLRSRHAETHRALRSRRCGPAERTRSERCRFLHSRNRAVHAAARRDGVRL